MEKRGEVRARAGITLDWGDFAPSLFTMPKSAVTPLLPVTIRRGGIRYAPGVRAGRWVFATGHKGTADFGHGMAADVVDTEAPRHGLPRHKKEAVHVFENF